MNIELVVKFTQSVVANAMCATLCAQLNINMSKVFF